MNTPKTAPENTRGDSLQKIAAGAALFGVLTSCDINGSVNNQDHETDFNRAIEQNDGSFFEEGEASGSREEKYREDRNHRLKPDHEIDKVFVDYEYLNEEELAVKEKIENRKFVQKEYLRLKSFLGKKIYYLEIVSYPFPYPIYCEYKEEYDRLLREYNVEKKHYALTEMEDCFQEKATPMGFFILNEKKMTEIIKRYAIQPGIMEIKIRDIWKELLEEEE